MLRYTTTAFAVSASLAAAAAAAAITNNTGDCRVLPGDSDWPSDEVWNNLNQTVGGRLIRGMPIASICYGSSPDLAACAQLRDDWGLVNPFLTQPIDVVPPYWDNNTCTPFVTAETASDASNCQLGNLAVYAINVSDAETAAAGVNFARDNNIRLIVKNTGHDLLGGSTGRGSLALWTHNLKNISLISNYSSSLYSGAAYRIGAGVQFETLQAEASANRLRVVGGSCPTVGANGGWRQGGGHGPLASAHSLGADNSLEYDVITADGKLVTASPSENSDLFYALSGGGAGNYGVVISAIVKAHPDSQFAGSRLTVLNDGSPTFWTVTQEWMKHLLVLDTIPGFSSEVLITQQSFALVVATLPGGTQASMYEALEPFYQTLNRLNVTPTVNETKEQAGYRDHYNEYLGGVTFTRNISISGRLIPRSLIPDEERLANLTESFKAMVADPSTVVYLLGYNVTNKAHNIPLNYSAVTPAWRDSLFTINVVIAGGDDDPWPQLRDDLALANKWQDALRDLTPGGGTYINEGTYNTPYWKDDYFGGTYDRLHAIKSKYDPSHVFYTRPGVASDEYLERADGHLCKVS